MIRFCHKLKTMIFDGKTFKVFFSKRGRWCSSSCAGSLPGKGNGLLEATGDSIKDTNQALYNSLQERKKFLNQKIAEIDKALLDIVTIGYKAEDLNKNSE